MAPFGVLGGSERWLLGLLDHAEGLRPAALLLSDGSLRDELQRRDVPVDVVPTGRRGRDVARASLGLARRLRGSRPDVVLANGVKAAAVAVPAARLARLPVVWAKHDRSLDRWLARPLGALATRVVAVSPHAAAATGRRDVVLLPPPRPNVPADRPAAQRFWSERGVDVGAGPTLAMVALLDPVKGIDVAIRALASSGGEDWRLVIVGPDDPSAPGEPARLAALARALGVADRVQLVGEVAQAGRWLAAFDAVAVLTRTDRRGFGDEGFGMVALEAVAARVPVVGAVTSPVVRDLASRCGVVVPPQDHEAVATALARIQRGDLPSPAGDPLAHHPDAGTVAAGLVAVLRQAAGSATSDPTGAPREPLTVSVVIATLERPEPLDRALASLAAATPPPDEVLVVDGDPDRSAAPVVQRWVERLPLRHLPAPRGLTRQRNAGLDAARGDVVVFIDDDARVPPDVVPRVREVYRDPATVGATGRVVEPHTTRIGGTSSPLRRLLPGGGRTGGFTRYGYPRRLTAPQRPQDVQFMQGCFMSVRRRIALGVRFDEGLPGYGLAEDEDFSYRLSQRGRIRYLPDLVVQHDNTGFLRRDRRRFGRQVVTNRHYLFRKNFEQTPLARAQFWGLIALLLVHRVLNRDGEGALGLLEGAWALLRGQAEVSSRSPAPPPTGRGR